MAYVIGLDDTSRAPLTWAKVQDGAPSDRQMLTWDSGASRYEYQWPGMTNFSEAKTFTILPSGSSVTTINAALTDYDVVYLEPGTYPVNATETIAVTNKQLIGLGESEWADTNGARFVLQAATAVNVIQLNNGRISNLAVYSAFAMSTDIIAGNTTNYANIVERVVVDMSSNQNVAAFVGAFVRIDQVRAAQINGVYFSGYTGLNGPQLLQNFYIYSAPTYGVSINCSFVTVRDGLVDGDSKDTDYGIYYNNSTTYSGFHFDNVQLSACVYGVYFNYATNRPWDVHFNHVKVWNCTTGYWLQGPARLVMSGCSADSCSDRGIYFYDIYYSAISGCVVSSCRSGWDCQQMYYTSISDCCGLMSNSSSSISYGNFVFRNMYGCSVTGLTSYAANNTNYGFMFYQGLSGSSFSGLSDYQSTYGIYVQNSLSDCSISDVNLYDSGSYGFYSDSAQRLRCTLSNIHVYSSGNYGFYLYDWEQCNINGLFTDGATGYGVYARFCYNTNFNGITSSWASTHGVYIDQCDHAAFQGVLSYYAGNTGLYITNCTNATFTGGRVYQAGWYSIYIASNSYTRVSDFMCSTNRTNGYEGIYLATNTGTSVECCYSYAHKRDGFKTLNATNGRSTIIGCVGIANSQESAGTYYNFNCQAIGAGTSLAAANHSVRAGQTFNPGYAFHADWNAVSCADVA